MIGRCKIDLSIGVQCGKTVDRHRPFFRLISHRERLALPAVFTSMTTESSTPKKQAATRPQAVKPPPAKEALARRARSNRAADPAEPAQATALQQWPEPPQQASPPLAAKAPAMVKRQQRSALSAASSAHESSAAGSVLSHVPPPRPGKVAKPPKLKKPKPVRDSFTMPKGEYQLIELLKARAAARQRHVKKSEILRAGILALANMTDAQLFAALDTVPIIKTGRPRADHEAD